MRIKLVRSLIALALAAPITLLAFSTGPPVRRTGAPIDGGLNCSVCHFTFAPANSDSRGSVAIAAASYSPGVMQTITVTVMHPEAIRWGFQITARAISDPIGGDLEVYRATADELEVEIRRVLDRLTAERAHDAP